jgi:ubiquinone/menaquinone biosynthesis C-methylase UbiE
MQDRPWERWDDAGVADSIESYWRRSAHEKAQRRALAELCAHYVRGPQEEVLEVGCGTGLVYEQLVPQVVAPPRYTGVDVSARMLEIARRTHPAGRFLLGDGYGLPFDDGAFDVAVSFEVLGHVPEVAPFVRELVRVSRRTALFTVWPCAEGVVEGAEEVCGSRFLHRQYSYATLCQEIARALPGEPLDLEVAVVHGECWAYVLHRRDGVPGLTLRRLLPAGGYRRHLERETVAGQR